MEVTAHRCNLIMFITHNGDEFIQSTRRTTGVPVKDAPRNELPVCLKFGKFGIIW